MNSHQPFKLYINRSQQQAAYLPKVPTALPLRWLPDKHKWVEKWPLARQWWYMPLITKLRKQRQLDLGEIQAILMELVPEQLGLLNREIPSQKPKQNDKRPLMSDIRTVGSNTQHLRD